MPLSTDLRGPCQLLQRGRLLALGGLRLPLPLPHPGHAAVPAVQCGPVYSQSSSQVRGGSSKGTGQAAHVAAPALAPVTDSYSQSYLVPEHAFPLIWASLSWLWWAEGWRPRVAPLQAIPEKGLANLLAELQCQGQLQDNSVKNNSTLSQNW